MTEQPDARQNDRETLEAEIRSYGLYGTVAIIVVIVSLADAIVLGNPWRAVWAMSFVLVITGLACFLALRSARQRLKALEVGLDRDGE